MLKQFMPYLLEIEPSYKETILDKCRNHASFVSENISEYSTIKDEDDKLLTIL